MIRRSLAFLIAAALAAGMVLSGCSQEGTGDKGFVSGGGEVREIAAADRGEPISYAGTDLEGQPLAIEDFRGMPLVIVVWGAWCAPCRKEAPEVAELARSYDGKAAFLGLNIRDVTEVKPQAMARRFDLPYASLFEPEGRAMLAFRGVLTPKSIPSFVVLDSEGRVASAINGALPSARTLGALVDDVIAEGSPGSGNG
ncbi:MAG: TlpA disulfide reductase family protein [Nocardioides sp.]